MENEPQNNHQIVSRNNHELVVGSFTELGNSIQQWIEWYLDKAVTTSESTRKAQRRDLYLFLRFMLRVNKSDARTSWTPRLSEEFRSNLIETFNDDGSRHWGDSACNRILANIRTFAKWLHSLRPFPLGNPMVNIRSTQLANPLEIERALTNSERRQLLDAADVLRVIGGRSKCRRRYVKKDERPVRKGYRPLRNRAIIYALVETGMRRQAVTSINLADIDFDGRGITVMEKGRVRHTYQISKEGLEAISDYIHKERNLDTVMWNTPALFLSACTNKKGNGRLSTRIINYIWNDVCHIAGVQGRTPHSARHAMGRWIMSKTNGNVAAVQRQLGHRNASYSMLYSRITKEELNTVLDDRNHRHE